MSEDRLSDQDMNDCLAAVESDDYSNLSPRQKKLLIEYCEVYQPNLEYKNVIKQCQV